MLPYRINNSDFAAVAKTLFSFIEYPTPKSTAGQNEHIQPVTVDKPSDGGVTEMGAEVWEDGRMNDSFQGKEE